MLKLPSNPIKAWLKQRRRLKKFASAQAWSDGRDLRETFEGIYSEAKWGAARDGSPFWSGNGSRPEFSAPYEDFVVGFLEQHPDIESVVDLGCGDFQVSRRILERLERTVFYTGCDIVRPLIHHHAERYGGPDTSFRIVNAVEEDPPAGDLVIIRQVLQHLSNEQARRVLERARRLFDVAIISESLPTRCRAPNLDIRHGIATRIALGSGIYVDEPPFSLPVAASIEVPHSDNELIRTSVVWFRPQTEPGHKPASAYTSA